MEKRRWVNRGMYKHIMTRSMLIILMSLGCLTHCTEDDSEVVFYSIRLDSVMPDVATNGAVISLFGQGFGVQGVEDQVTIGTRSLKITRWSEQRIDAQVPYDIQGHHWIVVSANGRISMPLPFEVIDDSISAMYNEAGNESAAAKLLTDLVAKRNDYASAHYALAVMCTARPDQYEKAKRHYTRYLELVPNDPSAAVIRKWIASH